ncbi:hypothetical protein TVAG_305380 [Trichomonas vaginalis G3]|uniref:Uncharacterized protein n=1 Tax=Trichomonas vaginalis (strain ATCC PRA-98 / G3) TaxID=412133 RepID=A2ERB2_TRIV3|nr:hypothetical protein TVAGG3_1003850 [Trichomonas vaginalis G3]EAY04788.1 hypothetical protein TVAG_305380 [Trichomonas vaginalis G3]KAI5490989.1 hypothetical protein TVAGG3_1003850 [Trichomonas vaginalis G3]|eukprot:XP_001317011.1 hypothetical protein [Trichomonas vaginalis G3]
MEETKKVPQADVESFDAIEYKTGFNIDTLKPQIGNIFQFFIPNTLFIPLSPQNANKQQPHQFPIWGSTHYTPNSDLTAIAAHTGALFIQKSKSAIRRRFCTIKNFYEVQNCSESDYTKIAQITEIPLDLTVKGVVLQILIDNSPTSYPSVLRNGIKSQELNQVSAYAIRVSNFFVISMYDDMPNLVSPEEYVRKQAVVPSYKFSVTGEVGIVYKPHMFLQIFSRFNVVNGFFNTNRLFFDIGRNRYEIKYKSATKFQLIQFDDAPTLNILKRKTDASELGDILEDDIELSEFSVTSKGIIIRKESYDPVDTILIAQTYNRYSQFLNA